MTQTGAHLTMPLGTVQCFLHWPPYCRKLTLLGLLPHTRQLPNSLHGRRYCATHGICGHRRDMDVLSCPRNIEAQPLPPSGQRKLQEVCPQLASEQGLAGGFCCTEEQLDRLQAQASPCRSHPSPHCVLLW